MNKSILITGASSGIGAACVKQATKLNLTVIATARSQSKLKSLQKTNKNVQIIVADISTETGQNIIAQSINQPLNYLLHNAAVLDTPEKFSSVNKQNFRNNILTNVEPIIFLTQKLLSHLQSAQQKFNYPSRILSVSSGAGKYAIAGMANYCISKAAALMANQILKIELPPQEILVNDYFPGVVDTGMQKTLRSSSSDLFPYSRDFKKLKQQGQLSNPMNVAADIMDIFTQSDDTEFVESEWLFKKTP